MYKLIAVDLDGTLLNSYGIVTENTKKMIKKCTDNGIETIIASGRPIDSIKTIAKEIGSEKYFIAGNGAIVYDIKEEKIIYEKFIPKEKILEIIKICEENSITYNLYTETTIIAKNLKKEENKKTKINIIENIYEYVRKSKNEKYLKITICDENKTIFDSIIRKLKKISDIEILDVSHMSRKIIKQGTEEISIEYYYTEISQKNVDKWYALEYLMNLLNIKKEEVMAIGDNINDEKMIKNAGLGIIMEGETPIMLRYS